MAGVYSTRFLLGIGADGSEPSYTVPSNMVAILDTIDVSGTTGGTQAIAQVDGQTFWTYTVQIPSGGGNGGAGWRGRCVLAAGETFAIYLTGVIGYQASGYLLTAP